VYIAGFTLINTGQKQLCIHRNIDIDFTKLTSIFTSSSNATVDQVSITTFHSICLEKVAMNETTTLKLMLAMSIHSHDLNGNAVNCFIFITTI